MDTRLCCSRCCRRCCSCRIIGFCDVACSFIGFRTLFSCALFRVHFFVSSRTSCVVLAVILFLIQILIKVLDKVTYFISTAFIINFKKINYLYITRLLIVEKTKITVNKKCLLLHTRHTLVRTYSRS